MAAITTRNFATVLLRSLCAILGLALIAELLLPAESVDTEPGPVKNLSTPTRKNAAFSLPDLAQFGEIVERPLFVQTRKPVAEDNSASPAQAVQDANLNQYSLSAVVISPEEQFALFRNTADKKVIRVEPGRQFQGWTVQELQPELVTLARDGQIKPFALVRKTPDQAQLQVLNAAAKARQQRPTPPPPVTPIPGRLPGVRAGVGVPQPQLQPPPAVAPEGQPQLTPGVAPAVPAPPLGAH